MAEINDFLSSKAEKQLEKYEEKIRKLVELYGKLETGVQGLEQQQSRQSSTQQDLDAQTRAYNQLLTQLNTVSGRLQVAESNLNEEVIRRREQLNQANRAIRDAVRMENAEANSITRLTARNRELRAERDNLNTSTREGRERIAAINEEMNRNTTIINENTSAQEQQRAGVGGYVAALKEWAGQLAGKLGIVALLTSMGSAIANVSKQMVKFNRYQAKIQKQFELTNEESERAATTILTLSENYEKSTAEIEKAAKALANEFDTTLNNSLELIQEGFDKGADMSGQFLDQLIEYPAQLKTMGLNAKQTISILTQNVQSGIFSDKGIDAIKEAGLRIREMPDATKSALEAIGLSSAKIQDELTLGAKTTFDIIQEVSAKLNELPEQSAAVGTAIADIFGGPGEDAGIRYLKSLKDINLEFDSLNSRIDLTTQRQNQLNESWTSFIGSISSGQGTLNKLYNSALKNISGLLDYISGKKEKDEFQLFTDSMANESIENLTRFKDTYENQIEDIESAWTDLQLSNADRGIGSGLFSSNKEVSQIREDVANLEELYSNLDVVTNALTEKQKSLNYEYDDANDILEESNRLQKENLAIKDQIDSSYEYTMKRNERIQEDLPDAIKTINELELEWNEKVIDSANKKASVQLENIKNVSDATAESYAAGLRLIEENKYASLEASSQVAAAIQTGLGESTAAGKVAGIATATIDGYVGVQKAFNDEGNFTLWQRIAAAATAASFAVANVRNILSVDTYATGTDSSTDTFIAGEAGRELMIDKKGNVMMVNDATLFTNQAGSKIYNNAETEQIMRTGGLTGSRQDLSPVVAAIRQNRAVQNVSLDKHGIISVSNGSLAKTKYVNRKFRHKS